MAEYLFVGPIIGDKQRHESQDRVIIEHNEKLLQKGYDINTKDDNGDAFIHKIQDVLFLEFAIKNHADLDLKDGLGNTLLHKLLMKEWARGKMIKMLIRNGADIYATNEDGYNCLEIINNRCLRAGLKKHMDCFCHQLFALTCTKCCKYKCLKRIKRVLEDHDKKMTTLFQLLLKEIDLNNNNNNKKRRV